MSEQPSKIQPSPENANYEFEFLEWPFYWLARADRQYMLILERALATVGLDIPRWRVLMVLHSKTRASVSEISDHSIVKLSTMTKIIQRMNADGLVTSEQSSADRRVTVVSITPKGEAAGRAASEIASRIMKQAFAQFSTEEINQLNGLLRKLTQELAIY